MDSIFNLIKEITKTTNGLNYLIIFNFNSTKLKNNKK